MSNSTISKPNEPFAPQTPIIRRENSQIQKKPFATHLLHSNISVPIASQLTLLCKSNVLHLKSPVA